jgi:hypothetical protein
MKRLILSLFVISCVVNSFAQSYPNPYSVVEENWAKLPDGRTMSAVVRCDATDPKEFGEECLDSDLDPERQSRDPRVLFPAS